ncbi:MAG: RNA polymerase sigma factor [Acidimicrobiales bacterium]
MGDDDLEALLRAAGSGDQRAWDALVDRFANLVWSIARSFRLSTADAADVSQTVWLRLVEHSSRIEDPNRLPGWLRTTTTHECLRAMRYRGRVEPFAELETAADPALDAELLADERHRAFSLALAALGHDCQQLLRLLCTDPPLSYADIAEVLGRPIGSLGPQRQRCLERLRRHPELRRIMGGPAGS